jgi:ABC-type multidrug transport system permease subunit
LAHHPNAGKLYSLSDVVLGNAFIPQGSMPVWLQIISHLLPRTTSVEALHIALSGGIGRTAWIDPNALAISEWDYSG